MPENLRPFIDYTTDRSDWKYVFQNTDSKCWENVAAGTKVQANNGVFFLGSDDATGNGTAEKTYRFTGKGVNMTDYIYTETTDVSKTVVLNVNDDAESSGSGADYTKNEDMSWNCFGLPYLVSEYKPYEQVNKTTAATVTTPSDEDPYRMNIPHTLWL